MFMNFSFQQKQTSLVRGLFQFTDLSAHIQLHLSFHFHSFSPWQTKLQQQVLMSSLIVQNFWCPAQRQCIVSPLSSLLSELLPVSFIISQFIDQFCLCLRLFRSPSCSAFLSLLSHSWTNSHGHIQKQVVLMSHFSCIYCVYLQL